MAIVVLLFVLVFIIDLESFGNPGLVSLDLLLLDLLLLEFGPILDHLFYLWGPVSSEQTDWCSGDGCLGVREAILS